MKNLKLLPTTPSLYWNIKRQHLDMGKNRVKKDRNIFEILQLWYTK